MNDLIRKNGYFTIKFMQLYKKNPRVRCGDKTNNPPIR